MKSLRPNTSPSKCFVIVSGRSIVGLQLVSQICGGKLIGDSMDSMEIKFTPGKISSGKYLADAKTAG